MSARLHQLEIHFGYN